MSKKHYSERAIDLRAIDPSPYQLRKSFDSAGLKQLASSIRRDGLISPVLVRPVGNRYELIAGERRFRAVRDYTDMQTIQARIVVVDDIGARRMSAAENLQREDLTIFETIEAIVEIVDAELMEEQEYGSMGEHPVDRISVLLGKLDSMRRSETRGSRVTDEIECLSRKFAGQVEKIFNGLPKSLKWRSFYRHDLPLLLSTCKEVQRVSIHHDLNKSQTTALVKLKKVSEDEFKRLANLQPLSEKDGSSPDDQCSGARALSGFSAAEIDAITDKEIKKRIAAEQGRAREIHPLTSKAKALLMNRLGIPLGVIAAALQIKLNTATRYCKNSQLFQAVRESLADGLSVSEAAKQHGFPEPLVWSFALEGMDDAQRFKALDWGLRTWDVWNWNDCDNRFGDDWPGRIPAQMIAHILYYYSDQGDLVFDPMAGGGVVADTCLAFNRKCRSFDLEVRPDTRPEIESHFWDGDHLEWPIEGNDRPDLVIFDPPYFSKKSGEYDSSAISGMSRETYLDFMKQFLSLTHPYTKPTCRIALINADWRDFQRTPARDEMRENAILTREYLGILDQSGWQETHIIQAPLSSERFTGNVVNAMQRKKTLGVISRYVIVAKKSG